MIDQIVKVILGLSLVCFLAPIIVWAVNGFTMPFRYWFAVDWVVPYLMGLSLIVAVICAIILVVL